MSTLAHILKAFSHKVSLNPLISANFKAICDDRINDITPMFVDDDDKNEKGNWSIITTRNAVVNRELIVHKFIAMGEKNIARSLDARENVKAYKGIPEVLGKEEGHGTFSGARERA